MKTQSNKIQKSAKKLIAGNFANFHRYGWNAVKGAYENNKDYFKNQPEIRKAFKKAYENKSVDLLNQLMIDFEIVSVYPLPTKSLL